MLEGFINRRLLAGIPAVIGRKLRNELYDKCIRQWDRIFEETGYRAPASPDTGIPALNEALDWLCDKTSSVLDFGCGNGTLLFLCALRGTERHVGIDLSTAGIHAAKQSSEQAMTGQYSFLHGGIERLQKIEAAFFDAIILSNILDNLTPEDSQKLIGESFRVLKPGGRVLVKLNPHLSEEEISRFHIRIVSGDFLDDGLYFLNYPTEQWCIQLSSLFAIEREMTAFFAQADQTNRIFLLKKSSV